MIGEAQTQMQVETPARLLPLSRRQRQCLTTAILMVVDALTFSAALWLSFYLRFVVLPYYSTYDFLDYAGLILAFMPAWLVILAAFQLYHPSTLFGGLQEYAQVFNAVTAIALAIIVFDFLRREDVVVSRGWLVLSWALSLVFVGGSRFLVRRVVYFLRRRGHLLVPALIVGANAEGCALADQLCQWSTSGLYITGFVDDDQPAGMEVCGRYKVLGSIEQIEQVVEAGHVQEVIVAPTAIEREQLLGVFRSLSANRQVNLRLSSGLFELLSSGLRVKELAYVPLIEVNKTRIAGMDMLLKALFDYSITLAALVVLWPLLLLLAVLVKLDSPGPVIYRRRVMGVNGTQFDAFKFRTMVTNGDEILEKNPELKAQWEREYKIKDDPRVTRLGKVLRKFSLDELPQIFNVLLGQMSWVGPRMISPPEMNMYGKWGTNLLTVKPGITGLWQVSGRSNVTYEDRVQLDMSYIRNWTIWMDIYIFFYTIPAVASRRGAY